MGLEGLSGQDQGPRLNPRPSRLDHTHGPRPADAMRIPNHRADAGDSSLKVTCMARGSPVGGFLFPGAVVVVDIPPFSVFAEALQASDGSKGIG
ncbi:hypothetical protein N7492_005000 [Penicillium capsulatum]|uniref:Uncharacterized protein n=1 Tax=Penicillium capsulatum TaxID=69766 RepID=A0A9W9LQR0_9EURO|nr:hypothetical protein N7492_005000 [Penicillium capsulatum]